MELSLNFDIKSLLVTKFLTWNGALVSIRRSYIFRKFPRSTRNAPGFPGPWLISTNGTRNTFTQTIVKGACITLNYNMKLENIDWKLEIKQFSVWYMLSLSTSLIIRCILRGCTWKDFSCFFRKWYSLYTVLICRLKDIDT